MPAIPAENKWLIAGIAALTISLGLLVLSLVVRAAGPATQSLFTQSPSTLKSPVSTPVPTPTPEPGLTIALMGRGGAGHDGGALTDTIVVARILDTQKRIVLLSIPRDLWVSIPQTARYASSSAKINFAYAAGGGALAKDVIKQVTGLTVDKYITIDFSGFEQAVDSIGGVDLTVDRAFTDYEYPIANREDWDCTTAQSTPEASSEADLIATGKLDVNVLPDLPKQYPCRYELLHFDAGAQHMDGKIALKYVRSRHAQEDGNDFARSRRQKILLSAVATKLFSIGAIAKIPTFFATLRTHVDTDFSATDILGLLPRAQEIHTYPITNLTLSTDNYLGQGYTADRQFELFPLTGQGNYGAIQNWIDHALYSDHVLKYPITEVDGFWKNTAGASAARDSLTAAGYPAKLGPLVMKNATTSATLLILTANVDPGAVAQIQKLASVSAHFVSVSTVSAKLSPNADLKLLLP